MSIYDWTRIEILIYVLIAFRMGAFVFSSGFFGYPIVNITLKLLFSLVLSFIMYPLIKAKYAVDFQEDLIISYATHELLVGLFLGFVTRLFFFCISQFAEIVGLSMGINSAQVLNPMTGAQSNVLDQFFMLIALLIYLSLDGHHALVQSLFQSYEIHGLGIGVKVQGFMDVVLSLQRLLIESIKLAAPIIVSMLLANIVMGIVGRAVPQINVLMTSFGVTMLLGIGILMITMPLVGQQSVEMMTWNVGEVFRLMRSF
ncbi:MAG: flagellar biosynthetic protein FliR [Bdellovibrionota bacterium]